MFAWGHVPSIWRDRTFVRACLHYLWSEATLDHSHVPSHRIHFQDNQFEHALLALNWLKGWELEGSRHVQI